MSNSNWIRSFAWMHVEDGTGQNLVVDECCEEVLGAEEWWICRDTKILDENNQSNREWLMK